MNNDHLIYLQEIPNTSWVIELISEQFDDAINMMTTNSIVYGGAVRDCLAGRALVGDLDIAVPSTEHNMLITRFLHNPKWVVINNGGNEYIHQFSGQNRSNIRDIRTFQTLGNKRVQIIVLAIKDNNPFKTVMHMAKQVDMVCCGVVLTSNGRVFEVVKSAYEDCKNNVLCLNKPANIKNLDRFQKRIEKFTKRGWDSNIDMLQVTRIVKKQQRQLRKTKQLTESITGSIKIIKQYNYSNNIPMADRHRCKRSVSKAVLNALGGLTWLLGHLDLLARGHKIDISVQEIHHNLVLVTDTHWLSKFVFDKVCNVYKPKVKTSVNWG